jgi:hypothetical protein
MLHQVLLNATSAAAAVGLPPSLVGHILFGLVTAYTWHGLSARHPGQLT